jgi:hypothetical protein
VQAQANSIHKYSHIIKAVTGDRLNKYTIINDLDFILEKKYASNIADAWKVNDSYVTLAQCQEIETNDIQRKISDEINKQP